MQDKKLDIGLLIAGKLRCDCGNEIPFDKSQTLELVKCSYCGKTTFVPMKISRFWLYMPLGGGGMGAVYKAISEDMKTICAVKILPRDKKTNQDFIKNLLSEINAAEKLGYHKNLVKLIDAGYSDNEYFMATEFIDGERLDRYLESRYQLTEREALGIMSQVLEAEKHIVGCGFLFRDLKPENIMIGKNKSIKLFDYGLCMGIEQVSGQHQASDQVEGSPYYMPPERIVGASEGEFSEIYSMGMLFFYMLSGKTYYSEAEINDLVAKHLTAIRINSTGAHIRNCSLKTISTIDKMIQRNPNSRFHDLASLETAFKEIESSLNSDEPSAGGQQARREVVGEPVGRLDKKKTAKFAGIAGLSVIALIVLLIVAGMIMRSARQTKIRREITLGIASMLGVPPDVLPPDIGPEELKKMISEKTDAKIAELRKDVVPFDEVAAQKEICERLKIGKFIRKKPDKTVAELEKMLKKQVDQLAEQEIQKELRPFDENKAENEIAGKLSIMLPPVKPSVSPESMPKEFKQFVKEKVDEKYSIQELSGQINKAHQIYGGYRIGQTVKVLLPSGEEVEGKYTSDLGDKLVVGGREIQKRDMSQAELWKFNEDICSKKVAEAVARIKQEYYKDKKEYNVKFESEEKDKFYAGRGYYKNASGAWLTAEQLLSSCLAVAKSDHEKRNEELKGKIRRDVAVKFQKDKYFEDSGYIRIDGDWVSEVDAVEDALSAEKKKFTERNLSEMSELRRKIRQSIENELYKKNGYVYYNGEWSPARKLLDELVAVETAKSVKKKN